MACTMAKSALAGIREVGPSPLWLKRNPPPTFEPTAAVVWKDCLAGCLSTVVWRVCTSLSIMPSAAEVTTAITVVTLRLQLGQPSTAMFPLIATAWPTRWPLKAVEGRSWRSLENDTSRGCCVVVSSVPAP